MSVLRDRIITQAGAGTSSASQFAALAPGTQTLMPVSEHTYTGDAGLYGTLHPLVTADGATIPARSASYVHQPWPAPVVPAGRP